MLALPPGATVVDVGCGTGLNFASTLAAIGPAGRIIGIDASSGMLAAALRRVQVAGWDNVTLVAGDARALLDLLRADRGRQRRRRRAAGHVRAVGACR